MADIPQLIREITNMYNVLAQAYYSYDQWISKLATLYGQITGGMLTKEEIKVKQGEVTRIFTGLAQLGKSFGSSVNRFNKQVGPAIVTQLKATTATPVIKTQSLNTQLVKLADLFDQTGSHVFADHLDKQLSSTADDSVAALEAHVKIIANTVVELERRLNSVEATQRGFQSLLATQGRTADLMHDCVKLADAFDKIGRSDISDQIDRYVKTKLGPHLMGMVKEISDLRDLVFALIARTNRMEKLQQKAAFVAGLTKLADFSDEVGAYVLANELDKMAEEEVRPIQQPNEGALSTRYCPDHNGIQAVRISERVYQCPIDGKVYNYETGYTNYKGQKVPGGSVAAQTPSTSDYGGIPMRIYDSRQTILNRVN